jgi:hypothetical protein
MIQAIRRENSRSSECRGTLAAMSTSLGSSVHANHAGQVIVAGYAAGDAPDELLDRLHAGALGGVILFKRNLAGAPHEIAARISRIAEASPSLAPIVAVDQEGGRVQRLGAPVLQLPPMRVLGERDDVELTRRAARVLGRQLAALGFNVDFAPVLDVFTNPKNEVIGDRAFGSEPERVAGARSRMGSRTRGCSRAVSTARVTVTRSRTATSRCPRCRTISIGSSVSSSIPSAPRTTRWGRS